MISIKNDTVITICLTTLAVILLWEIFDHLFGDDFFPSLTRDKIKKQKKQSTSSKSRQHVHKSGRGKSKNIIISGKSGTITITPALVNAMAKKFPDQKRTTLVRFLVGRKASLTDAIVMLENYLEWYKNNMPPSLEVASAALGTKCMFTHGTALDGSPILYFRGALYDSSAAPSMSFVLSAAYMIDKVIAPLEEKQLQQGDGDGGRGESITVLIHTSFVAGAINAPADIGFIKDFVKVLSDNYPERLRRLIIYPFPWFGRAIWQVIRPFMDPRTADKVILLSQGPGGEFPCPPAISEYVDINQIPIICGGKSETPIEYPTIE